MQWIYKTIHEIKSTFKTRKGVISIEFIIITVLAAALAIGIISIMGPAIKGVSQNVTNTITNRVVGQ
ncbi:MAG: hypothetical protein ACPLVF_02010 [Thermovenabulum sp.]|uniref:hypothetical protein n=1 Tax=Thermovenabulum sp. TaxID=3100335 RepID=UPI003C7D0160